jgi:hypothetical protein
MEKRVIPVKKNGYMLEIKKQKKQTWLHISFCNMLFPKKVKILSASLNK